jgi:hypothetical protein
MFEGSTECFVPIESLGSVSRLGVSLGFYETTVASAQTADPKAELEQSTSRLLRLSRVTFEQQASPQR